MKTRKLSLLAGLAATILAVGNVSAQEPVKPGSPGEKPTPEAPGTPPRPPADKPKPEAPKPGEPVKPGSPGDKPAQPEPPKDGDKPK